MSASTREPQYNRLLDIRNESGVESLGLMANQMWHDDPRHLLFALSRYKFISKMLAGKKHVLEVGCGDGFGARIVRQTVPSLCAVDFDPVFVADNQARMTERWPYECKVHDILAGPVVGEFDAAYSLDVIEHIPKSDEHRYLENIIASLKPKGVLIIGTPSLESQVYASANSKAGHVNCKRQQELADLLDPYFDHVFSFGMNDEVVHTGYGAMAHYLFALCVGIK